jgi:4-hydroxythreonine-4-phosphate dehydrogenase
VPLALTLGEPAGIGPDLSLLLWTERQARALPPFVLLGEPAYLAARAKALGLEVPIAECGPEQAAALFATRLPVLPLGLNVTASPGRPDGTSAAAAARAITQGVELVRSGRASALVTNPIAKHVMQADGFGFPGHTEYLAYLAGGMRPVMLIWSEPLAVIPVTIHLPLAEVPRTLSERLIVESGEIAAADYRKRFGIAAPRLAVCGLNPHAGEQGTLGHEDEAIVRPAIRALQAKGIDASGPHAADSLFHEAARKRYDVALGMYHDQVLAPVKALAFDRAVNVTLGLPFVRTSPDHGTAFDLAGTGKANPSSLDAAIQLAAKLGRRA